MFERKMEKSIKCAIKTITILALIITCSCSDDDVPHFEPEPPLPPTYSEYRLADGVVELGDAQISQIENVVGNKLVFSSRISVNDLPKKGEIILISGKNANCPNGFLGRVFDVKCEDKISIITEPVALDEVFDYLDARGACYLEPDEAVINSRAVFDYKYTLEYESSSGSVSGNMDIKNRIRVDYDFKINEQDNLNNAYIQTSFDSDYNVWLEAKFKTGVDTTINLGKGISLGRIVAGPIILVPILQPYWKPECNGNIDVKFDLDGSSSCVNRAEYNHGLWSFSRSVNNQFSDINPFPEICVNGAVGVGIGLALEFRLYGNKNLKIYSKTAFGASLSGEVSVDPSRLQDDESVFYSQLKDAKLSCNTKFDVVLGASAKLFNKLDSKAEVPFEFPIKSTDLYVLPAFKKGEVDINNKTISAYTEVERNLLWKQNIGFAHYEGKKRLEISEPIEYKNEKKDGMTAIQYDFKNGSKKSSIWTYVKWGNLFIKCEMVSKSIVGSWRTSDYEDEIWVFDADGTGYIIELDETHVDGTFSWTIFGDELIFTSTDWDDVENFTIRELTGTTLVLYDNTSYLLKTFDRVK